VVEETPSQEVLSGETADIDLDDLVTCSEKLAKYRENTSCYYQDGIFNPSQRTDIDASPYKDAIQFVTQQCYYHGQNDTQALFDPDRATTQ